jgi:hypothetical protein
MNLAERVAGRFIQAEAIGDPKGFLVDFARGVERVEISPDTIAEARKLIIENNTFYQAQVDALRKKRAENPSLPMGSRRVERVPGSAEADMLAARAYVVVTNAWKFLAEPGHKLFLSILQTLALPPALRKKVEIASRVYIKKWVKPRVKNKYGFERALEYFDIYEKFIGGVHDHLDLAKKAIAQGKAHAEEGPQATKVRVGDFVLVNTGGFNEKVMGDVAEVMKKAQSLAKSSGFGSVCYGEVQVTNTISKGNVLAFYLIANDELFVRANVKSEIDSVRTVLHELGHRYEKKFLAGKDREIQKLYYLLSGQERDLDKKKQEARPKPGEIWAPPNSKYEYQVLYTQVTMRGTQVHLQRVDNPKAIAQVSLEGYLQGKGDFQHRNFDDQPDYKGFVTDYAKKGGPSENFAEMFSFYCMGRLPVLQSVPFEELAFGSSKTAQRVLARWVGLDFTRPQQVVGQRRSAAEGVGPPF